ncbi:hypothetical protein EDC04DRAFT_2627584, partial [Pisolithus marmoratus]
MQVAYLVISSMRRYATFSAGKRRHCFANICASDAPRRECRNRILMISAFINFRILYPSTENLLYLRNCQHDKIWNKMSSRERAHYL